MVIQCRVCKKVRHNGHFRQAWPGELPIRTQDTYCPDCAQETLKALQRGETPWHYENAASKAS